MSELHLDSLEIKNFRCFEHLVIEKLGRVNLIVGKNSVGKSCLLEALQIFASKADSKVLKSILVDRNEFVEEEQDAESEFLGSMKNLFYKDENVIGKSRIHIGSSSKSIKFGIVYLSVETNQMNGDSHRVLKEGEEVEFIGKISVAIKIEDGEKTVIKNLYIPEVLERHLAMLRGKNTDAVNYKFIPTTGLSNNYMADLWDSIALTPLEAETTQAMQKIDKEIEKYSFHGDKPNRTPRVKRKSEDNPVHLRRLGEGISRALGIALALTNAQGGLLLIDEFESGLHHGVQLELWRITFKLAKKLNIQVFATTHSWDCVEAFQEAAAEDQNEGAMLIRLQQKRSGEGIEAVLYDEELLAKATRQQVEVR